MEADGGGTNQRGREEGESTGRELGSPRTGRRGRGGATRSEVLASFRGWPEDGGGVGQKLGLPEPSLLPMRRQEGVETMRNPAGGSTGRRSELSAGGKLGYRS